MAYLIIENFANGLDLRKSPETAPVGSLRVLKNAFINEGGEIEKRKAFSKISALTEYGQSGSYKGRITGPFACPGFSDKVFFRHRHNSLPGGDWNAGAGSIAESQDFGDGINEFTAWVAKSTIAMASNSALFHAMSYGEYSNKGYIVERNLDPTSKAFNTKHIYQTFTDDEPTAESEVTANADRDYQMILKDKGYVVKGKTMYASAVGDPSAMTGSGSGNVDLTTQGQPIGDAFSMADYFGQLAIFGRRGVQFYTVDADFANNQYQRTVKSSIFAPGCVVGYGDGDVVFLGRNGVRSLQARDSSNLARISDLGSPIDKVIKDALLFNSGESEAMFNLAPTYNNANYYNLAKGIIYPDLGQMWIILKEKVYVLSYFPGAKVQAWSEFDLPVPDGDNRSVLSGTLKGRWIADICPVNETLIMRNYSDEVFIYGGLDGETYDSSHVEIITPFLDMGKPGHVKTFTGIDMVCEGSWNVEICTQPSSEDVAPVWTKVAEVEGSTRNLQKIGGWQHAGVHLALRFTSNDAYAAKIGQVTIYYDGGSEK